MKLFTNFNFGSVEIKNRIIMAPMCTNYDITSKKAINYYVERAKGGVGLIIIENTFSSLFDDNDYLSKLPQLPKSIHDYDSKVFIQLSVSPATIDLITRKDINKIDFINDMKTSEIELCINSLQKAAYKSYLNGFDGIEIHGAHGYFINSFLNPYKNKRTDIYGGSFIKRMRFSLDCVIAIRSLVPDDFIISFRLNGSDIIPNGTPIENTIEWCKNLETAGVDVIHVSAGIANTPDELVTPSKKEPFGVFSDYAAKIKQNVSIPVISVGKNHNVTICESILQDNKADLIAVGRPLIADSDWVKKIKNNKEKEIINCIYCNNCIRQISEGNLLKCKVNKNL